MPISPMPSQLLALRMKAHNLRVRGLAELCDIHPTTLYNILNGSARLEPKMVVKLSLAIGLAPIDWLIAQAYKDAADIALGPVEKKGRPRQYRKWLKEVASGE